MEDYKNQIKYLKNNFKTPKEYIVDKFNSYDVILLGEHHGIKENLLLMHKLIPILYENVG